MCGSIEINRLFLLCLQRGDSVDTVYISSPPSVHGGDRLPRMKHKSKKRNSPMRRRSAAAAIATSSYHDDSSDPEETSSSPERTYRGLMLTDCVGNFTTEMSSQSVVLNIDDHSSTNSSDGIRTRRRSGTASSVARRRRAGSGGGGGGDDDDRIGGDRCTDGDDELHCDDWEIRMLAAELNRRESQRDINLEGYDGDPSEDGRLLRRRHNRRSNRSSIVNVTAEEEEEAEEEQEDENHEMSDVELDQMVVNRPRALSLDQQNLRRQQQQRGSGGGGDGKGRVFKAMSFERDKDQL